MGFEPITSIMAGQCSNRWTYYNCCLFSKLLIIQEAWVIPRSLVDLKTWVVMKCEARGLKLEPKPIQALVRERGAGTFHEKMKMTANLAFLQQTSICRPGNYPQLCEVPLWSNKKILAVISFEAEQRWKTFLKRFLVISRTDSWAFYLEPLKMIFLKRSDCRWRESETFEILMNEARTSKLLGF